jgi:hypothetical protein
VPWANVAAPAAARAEIGRGTAGGSTGQGSRSIAYEHPDCGVAALRGRTGDDYGQYVRDAKNGGFDDIADFFERVMQEDSERAAKCHQFLAQLSGTEHAGSAAR